MTDEKDNDMANSDIISMREKVEARNKEAQEKFGNGGGDGESGLDSKFVRMCLWANEMGDGELYKKLHQRRSFSAV